jgi:hypothetical protein
VATSASTIETIAIGTTSAASGWLGMWSRK